MNRLTHLGFSCLDGPFMFHHDMGLGGPDFDMLRMGLEQNTGPIEKKRIKSNIVHYEKGCKFQLKNDL